jgi:FdhD protein
MEETETEADAAVGDRQATWEVTQASRIGQARFGVPVPPPALVPIAAEVPVAFCYSGVDHAVMMATPDDLQDFALGFSVCEGVAEDASALRDVRVVHAPDGITLEIALAPAALRRFLARGRVRARPGHAGCGVCGVSDLAQAVAGGAGRVATGTPISPAALRRALAGLEARQTLNRRTHAVHAAAWADPDGDVLALREDVGRHNALDKLIGAGLRAGFDFGAGFCVITSRCSFEMVQKAAIVGMPVLAAISAPTALALRRAEETGMTLIGFARADGQTVYANDWRIIDDVPHD